MGDGIGDGPPYACVLLVAAEGDPEGFYGYHPELGGGPSVAVLTEGAWVGSVAHARASAAAQWDGAPLADPACWGVALWWRGVVVPESVDRARRVLDARLNSDPEGRSLEVRARPYPDPATVWDALEMAEAVCAWCPGTRIVVCDEVDGRLIEYPRATAR